MGFWLKLLGAIILFGVAGMVIMAIIGAAWYAWGLLGMFVFVAGVLALVAWVYDRQRSKRYEDLSEDLSTE